MLRLCLLVGVCLSACQFDERGIRGSPDSGASGGPDAPAQPDGAPAIDAPLPVDATLVPCIDSDGDTFLVVNIDGATCPGPLDCDDSDPDAYPGQESYFDSERMSGGYDFNCDGAETLLNETAGGTCREEWWECLGTGWVQGVPMCGEVGTYHICEDVGNGCEETSRVDTNMLCR